MDAGLPLISLCTVTHNRSHLLPLLQECVREQTYPHSSLEWVIVDDSTQKSAPFRPDPGLDITVRLVYLPAKLKLGEKRNISHTYCQGEIIVYMDDDDWYPPTRVEHAVQTLRNSDTLVAGTTYLPILFLPEREVWLAGPYHKNHGTANTFAFKRELLEITQYNNNSSLAEEQEFLKNYTLPMAQLEPCLTVLCIGHSSNTFDKRKLTAPASQRHMTRITNELWPSEKLSNIAARYSSALGLPATKPKAVFIAGPWGSGTSAVAGALCELGLHCREPYLQSPFSYQTKALHDFAVKYIDEASLEIINAGPALSQALDSLIRSFQAGHANHNPERLLLHCPIAAILLPELCSQLDIQLVVCLRSLEAIEATRTHYQWPALHGMAGAELIYGAIFTHVVNTPIPVHLVHHENLTREPRQTIEQLGHALHLETSSDSLDNAADKIIEEMQNLSGKQNLAPEIRPWELQQ